MTWFFESEGTILEKNKERETVLDKLIFWIVVGLSKTFRNAQFSVLFPSMPVETLSIRNRSAIGRFPSGTLTLEDPDKVKPEKPDTKWTCSTWLRQCCQRCCCRKHTDEDAPGTTNDGDSIGMTGPGNLTRCAVHWAECFGSKNNSWINMIYLTNNEHSVIIHFPWSTKKDHFNNTVWTTSFCKT